VGPGTPTLAPVRTAEPTPTRPNVITFGLDTPSPTPGVTCETVLSSAVVETAGWLNLPFPYDGTAEQFRRISQRSRFGGRINSFFDHEYPVYPPSVNGLEPLNPITVTQSLVIFDGSRSVDAYMDANDGDWYSGHSGIDFSPENAFREETPVLAAADGFLYLARIDNDGNHMVWIEHDPDGNNRHKYMTLYFHLKSDPFFEQRVAQYALMEETDERITIAAGERIGTMGTTGRSSGIHLHFEVRYDANNDRIYSRFERIDPYGFFPSEEIPVDPWSVAFTWMDNKETEQEHPGIASTYLWKHPLVDVDAEAGEVICAQEVNVQIDLYPIYGWAVVDPGFTNIIYNEQGEVVDVGEFETRELTILPGDLAFVDIETLSLEFLPPGGDAQGDWRTIPRQQTELIERPNGGYRFRMEINQTGRYVVVGRQTKDLIPPVAVVNLDGERVGEGNTFNESVVVTLIGADRGYPAPSGVREVQYSLDCGANWVVYDGEPLTITQDTPHSCGESGVGEQGVQYGENQFQLLAIATDFNDNVQQPASQVIFTIE
jgi:murein DD-endopeptidase MepM/ murein hydrolase activator NlpD